MPGYKLYYFDGQGKAELTRLCFTYGGLDFDDIRVSYEDWPALKPTTPWGTIPFLEIDGQRYGESKAIARLIAKEIGIIGQGALEQCKADAIVDVTDSVLDVYYDIKFHLDDQEEEKERRRKEFFPKLDSLVAKLEQALCANKGGDGYFVGDKLTWADLSFFAMCDNMARDEIYLKERVGGSAKLSALFNRVKNDEKLTGYLSKRTEKAF